MMGGKELTAIVCVDGQWGIGKNGALLFSLPEDMKFFRKTTLGGALVVGRTTLTSFPGGKPLPGRAALVLSRDTEYTPPESAVVCRTLTELSAQVAALPPEQPVFVAGGESIYRLLLPYCTTARVTRVQQVAEADRFFPDLEAQPGWMLESAGEWQQQNECDFRFCIYRNEMPKVL